jgi:hypothetical protein
MDSPDSPDPRGQDFCLAQEGIVELELLLPAWEAAALEEAAHRGGPTVAQLVRRLIRDYFGKFVQARRPDPACIRLRDTGDR